MPERQDPEGRLLARAAEIRRNFPFNGLLDRFRIDADGQMLAQRDHGDPFGMGDAEVALREPLVDLELAARQGA